MRDRQDEHSVEDEPVWSLNGQEVSKGWLGCLQTLPEGEYELEVVLHGRKVISAQREFKVARPQRTGS